MARSGSGRGDRVDARAVDGLEYDTFYQCGVLEVAQTKTSKLKRISLVIGRTRRSCWFLKFADHMAMSKHRLTYNSESGGCWLFPELQSVKTVSKKLTSYHTAVTEENGLQKFKSVGVQLPDGMCAGGICPGG